MVIPIVVCAVFAIGFISGRSSGDAGTDEPDASVESTLDIAPLEPSTTVVQLEEADAGGSSVPTAPSVGGKAFFESFESMSWDAFRTGVYHRDVDAHGFPMSAPGELTWQGDHDLSCGSPATKRTLDKSDRSSSFYVCNPGPSGTNQHGMTSVGHVDSYSVAWFSPKQTFSSISEVCWDVNISTDVLGHRQWWEVSVEPVDGPDVTAISWLAGTANVPDYGEARAVVLGFGPDNPPYAKLSVGNDVVGEGSPDDPEARGDVRIRRPHCLTWNEDLTVTYSTVDGEGEPFIWTTETPVDLPAGELKVVFKDHNYTPNKDCTPCRAASAELHLALGQHRRQFVGLRGGGGEPAPTKNADRRTGVTRRSVWCAPRWRGSVRRASGPTVPTSKDGCGSGASAR